MTHYIVHHEAPFVMHIGQPCPELKALMAEHNALSAAFITAWNPFSQNLPAKENHARQDELKANLKKRGLICIDGSGKHPSNDWPGEVSVLVLGLDLEAAKSPPAPAACCAPGARPPSHQQVIPPSRLPLS